MMIYVEGAETGERLGVNPKYIISTIPVTEDMRTRNVGRIHPLTLTIITLFGTHNDTIHTRTSPDAVEILLNGAILQ
jgi:hypothetical protein